MYFFIVASRMIWLYSHILVMSASELIKPRTHCVLMRKHVSALGACSTLLTIARACMRHDATHKKKCFANQCLLATHWNELTASTKVPLYLGDK